MLIYYPNHKDNAMKRNSTYTLAFRKLLVDAKQWKDGMELASERLSEILKSRHRRIPTVTGEGYKIQRNPYPVRVWSNP